MPGHALGIDFGTSHTVAVLRSGDGVEPLLFDGSPLLPSAAYAAPDGTLVVGRDALDSSLIAPAGLEPTPKRRVDDGSVLLGDRELAVVEVFAAVLARVRGECVQVNGAVPPEVVVTHPAVWASSRRMVLRDAALKAGFTGVRLEPEPVAAAGYFVHRLRHEVAVGDVVVVHDFGGGTVDASVVRRTGAGFEVLSMDGLGDFGGIDIDAAISTHLRAQVGDADAWQRLLAPTTPSERRAWRSFTEDVRLAKERLSRQVTADLYIPVVDVEVHLTRAELEKLARPLLARAVAVTAAVIADAGVPKPHIAGLFLTGGASRMPLVATMLHQALGLAPVVTDRLEQVVAHGALLAAERRATVADPDETATPRRRDEPAAADPVPAEVPRPKPPPRGGPSWPASTEMPEPEPPVSRPTRPVSAEEASRRAKRRRGQLGAGTGTLLLVVAFIFAVYPAVGDVEARGADLLLPSLLLEAMSFFVAMGGAMVVLGTWLSRTATFRVSLALASALTAWSLWMWSGYW